MENKLLCVLIILSACCCLVVDTVFAEDLSGADSAREVGSAQSDQTKNSDSGDAGSDGSQAFGEQERAGSGSAIESFEDCIAAGYLVTKSFPPQCHTPDGRIFVKKVKFPGLLPEVPVAGESCKDLCGDGQCQEIVCLALGCPCAETPDSCPQDCSG